MSIGPQQVKQFKEQGYTSATSFFSEREVRAMRAELGRLRESGAFRNVTTDGDGKTTSKTKENLQICPLYTKSTFFRALAFHPKVLAAIPQLIGDPVVLHLDQVFLKPARHGSGTSWHQDNAYFQIDQPARGTAMWIAVHDATLANGTIRVVPGLDVATSKLEHSRDPHSDHHIRCYPDESRAVPIELPAGGVAFFCYGTPHSTGANNTDKDRAGVAFHFLHQSCYTDELRSRAKPIGTMLTGPEASGGLKEYGEKIQGTWESEVEKALAYETVAV
jgi:ectoine hydroxylase-related dioxygenase (phytanoyl-CoA dioxygenase family)